MSRYWVGTQNYNPGGGGIHYLFPHWTAGPSLESAVSTLRNPANQASANYVIQDDEVAQLVLEGDTSWHCSNGYYNARSISYELVGYPGHPPTKETLDTCAEMMAEASRNYFGSAELVLGENVMLHRMVYNTSCPGETDIDYLLARANDILNGEEEDMTPEEHAMLDAVYTQMTRTDTAGHDNPQGHDIFGRIQIIEKDVRETHTQVTRTDTAGHDNPQGHDLVGRVQIIEKDAREIKQKLDTLIDKLNA